MTKSYPFPNEIVAAVLDRYYSGVQFSGGIVTGDSLPDDADFAAKVANYLESQRVNALKGHAGLIILARFPDWKQRNMIAHSLKLDRIARTRTLDIDEQTAYDSYEAAWAWVEKIRLESDRLEKIPGATVKDGNWNP